MTRTHVQALQRAARAVRGHVEYRTRAGRLALPDGSAAFARLCVAEVPRELRGRVAGWRLGVWREREPGVWAVECWPEAPIAPWDVAREQGREIATRAIVAVATVRPHEPSAVDWREAGRGRLIADWRATLPAWADAHAQEWWALTDVVALANPVPVPRGQFGLWKLDPETEAAVRREEDACRT